VGEIGIDRNTFFNQLRWWEVRAIISGYNRRHRDIWSATRWQTYNIMAAQVGGKELEKNGISSPNDLLTFPWEHETNRLPTEEEVEELQDEIAAINAASQK
jgi:hypothetical protein